MRHPVIGVTCGYGPAPKKEGKPQVNHFSCGPDYVDAVDKAGGAPVLLPACESIDRAADVTEAIDGLLLIGGPDVNPARYHAEPHPKHRPLHPRREAFELALVAEAGKRDLPVMAICLGIQVLNVARGGSLIQDLPSERPEVGDHSNPNVEPYLEHSVEVVPDTLLASIVGAGEFRVNSSHHQAVERLGEGLVVSARGQAELIEAIEDPRRLFFLGLQWHPERLCDEPKHLALFEALVEATTHRIPY